MARSSPTDLECIMECIMECIIECMECGRRRRGWCASSSCVVDLECWREARRRDSRNDGGCRGARLSPTVERWYTAPVGTSFSLCGINPGIH
eukprot:146971-Prorocentrum_minimum.AAC.1